jgi:hypothetical protein
MNEPSKDKEEEVEDYDEYASGLQDYRDRRDSNKIKSSMITN